MTEITGSRVQVCRDPGDSRVLSALKTPVCRGVGSEKRSGPSG